MKIARFQAPDMRQALRKVRDSQGPDAVILSSHRVPGGVEVVAAVDYDERQAARFTAPPPRELEPAPVPERPADEDLDGLRREIRRLGSLLQRRIPDGEEETPPAWLEGLQLTPDLQEELAAAAASSDELATALGGRIPVVEDAILEHGGVVALLGPTGVGKTTTVAKLAARFALRHGRRHVALVSTDSFRIGAEEQLHIFGKLLGVPVLSANDSAELARVLDHLGDKRLVLIDNAGLNPRDLRLGAQLQMNRCVPFIKSYLVLSAVLQRSVLTEVTRAYREMRLQGCILTKLDEAVTLGDLLSTVIRERLPVAYAADGQRVPEDLHPGRRERLAALAIELAEQYPAHGMSQVRTG